MTSTAATTLSGDLGVSPGTAVVGFPPGTVNGAIRTGGGAAQAQADLLAAYNNAAARTPTASFAGDNNGRTFTPGVHHTAAAFALTGTMTLDGQGDPNAVFIFQVGAALNTAAASQISLINGAKAPHIFWQVLGAAGTGASSSFSGTIMAAGAITIGAGGSLAGRALSRDTVTLAGNTVTTVSDPVVTITGGAAASTNDATPTITGTTDAPASTTVTVTVAGQTLTTAVQPGGAWAVTAATLTEGPHSVMASVSNLAGFTGAAAQTLTIDTSVPVVTITGGAASATNTATPTIAGTVDAAGGTPVTVSVAGQTLTTPVQSGGTWAVTTATLVNGTHTVVASVTDMAGNTGTADQALTVDTTIALVALGAAGTYSVLAGTRVTSLGATVVSGDLGVSPGTAVVGFPPGVVNGAIRTGVQASQAQADLLAAYNNAAARVPTASFAGDNNGRTFTPGVHHTAAAFALTGTMTLDGQGDPNAVFIFQVDAALNTAAASQVSLINGAKAPHIFWQVLGAAGTGALSSFSGTIMAAGAITIGAGGSLAGRALSRDTVTLAGQHRHHGLGPRGDYYRRRRGLHQRRNPHHRRNHGRGHLNHRDGDGRRTDTHHNDPTRRHLGNHGRNADSGPAHCHGLGNGPRRQHRHRHPNPHIAGRQPFHHCAHRRRQPWLRFSHSWWRDHQRRFGAGASERHSPCGCRVRVGRERRFHRLRHTHWTCHPCQRSRLHRGTDHESGHRHLRSE